MTGASRQRKSSAECRVSKDRRFSQKVRRLLADTPIRTQIHTHTHTQPHKHILMTDTFTYRHTLTHTDRQTCRQTDGQTHRVRTHKLKDNTH